MIVELNKLYILTAPPATSGMTQGDDEFIESNSPDVSYQYMKALHQASNEVPVKSLAKVFEHQGQNLQAVYFFTNYPITKVKKKLNDTVAKYAKNLAAAKKAK